MNEISADLKEAIDLIKGFGFDVYIPDSEFYSGDYCYITNNIHILYLELSYFGTIRASTECIPSKATGSGLSLGQFTVTKENILKAFDIKYGKQYDNFEHFKRAYEEIYFKLKKV